MRIKVVFGDGFCVHELIVFCCFCCCCCCCIYVIWWYLYT